MNDMFTVYKLSYSGMRIPIEEFKNFKEAKEFCDKHLNFSLGIINESTNHILYERIVKE